MGCGILEQEQREKLSAFTIGMGKVKHSQRAIHCSIHGPTTATRAPRVTNRMGHAEH